MKYCNTDGENGAQLDDYDDFVTRLADLKSDELISNGQVEHARSIIRNLISHAENEVRIFSSSLCSAIYSDPKVLNAIENFLSKAGTKFRILIQKSSELDRQMPLVQLFAENSQCEMREVTDVDDQLIQQHMIVMDKVGYRFCPERGKHEAIASFNAPTTSVNLANQFDILSARAEILSIQPIAA